MAKILIIDDRPLNRQFLTTLLGYLHHDLREASDGAEGLRVAREQRPDLIISDVLMPTMDGYEFVRRLREDPEIGKTPVIFSTAHYLSRESQALAAKCGITSIIFKPCEPDIVLRIVDDALNGRALEPAAAPAEGFDQEHLRLLTDQLSKKANALRATNQKLTALATSSQEVLLEREPPRLLNKYCELARALVGAKWAALALAGDDGESLGHFHAIGLDEGSNTTLQSNLLSNPVLLKVTRDLQPRRFNSQSAAGLPEEFSDVSSLLVVPLILQNKVRGCLCLADKLGVSDFAESDQELVVTLAAHMTVAYDNATLLKNARAAEEAARAAAEKYLRFFDNAFVGIYQTTPDGRFITANLALAHMKGYRTSAELISNTDVRHPNYVDPHRYDEFKLLMEKQDEVRNFESEVYRRDHSIIWISENTRAVRDESGELLYYEGFIKDITEHKRAEQAIRSTPTMLLAGIGALAFFVVLGIAEHFMEGLLGEAIALSVSVIIAALTAAGITHLAMKRQGELYRRTLEEIAERKRAEDVQAQLASEMESQRRRLDNIVASVPGVVWETWGEPDESTQRISFVSDYVETMLGYSVDEWISTPQFWLSIVHPDDQEEAARIAGASFASGTTSPQEFRWVAKDGRVIWVESTYAVITDDEDRPVGMRGVTLDINERKRLEQELRQAQKMESIGTLAGGIAHDFNNILGVIIGYTELAQKQVTEASRAHAHLEQVLKASSRAGDLVRQILTFSRQGEHEREVIQLQPIIAETLKLLRASLPSTIEIRQSIDAVAPAVLADATQIQQVIINLCTNAGHAMQERGGVLDVSLAEVDIDPGLASTDPQLGERTVLRLMVSDTGCGMSSVTQERIFDPFFTTKGPGEGTGLGLAVVHGVVKNHGGAVSVDSEPGAGATFSVYLPICVARPDAVTHRSVTVPRGHGEHILFVDDEEALVRLGRLLLEDLGYRVTTSSDGVDALSIFKAQPEEFDLVLTDQTMPHMNGADLTRALLQIRPSLPVILTTGYTAGLNPEKARAMGVRELLAKPNTAKTLGEAIRRVIGNGEGKEI